MLVINIPNKTKYCVYGLIKDKKIFFVGYSKNVFSRIGEHTKTKKIDSFVILGGDDDFNSALLLETEMMEIYETNQKPSSVMREDFKFKKKPVYVVQPNEENNPELIKLRDEIIKIKRKVAEGRKKGKSIEVILRENKFSKYKYYRFRDMRKIPKNELMKYRSKEKITKEMEDYIATNFKKTSEILCEEILILFGIQLAMTTVNKRKHKIANDTMHYRKRVV